MFELGTLQQLEGCFLSSNGEFEGRRSWRDGEQGGGSSFGDGGVPDSDHWEGGLHSNFEKLEFSSVSIPHWSLRVGGVGGGRLLKRLRMSPSFHPPPCDCVQPSFFYQGRRREISKVVVDWRRRYQI